jgi:hydrogenase expression/formation protein HypC
MCLAIPGKVLEIDRSVSPIMGTVSFGGIRKGVCLEWVPEVRIGEYVIVHVGFAISTMDEQEALETLQLLEEMEEYRRDFTDDAESQPPASKDAEASPSAGKAQNPGSRD